MTIAKALIVDDSKVAFIKLSKMLDQRNIETEWASSGEEGIDYLKRHRTDVVFMDIIMPGIDGIEATNKINNDPEIAAPPIIVCSSSSSEDVKENVERCGALGFLAKPYTPQELDRVLNSVREHQAAHAFSEPAAPVDSLVEEPAVAAEPLVAPASQQSLSPQEPAVAAAASPPPPEVALADLDDLDDPDEEAPSRNYSWLAIAGLAAAAALIGALIAFLF